jgi:hypothetical protein
MYLPAKTLVKGFIPNTATISKPKIEFNAVFICPQGAEKIVFQDVAIHSPDRGIECHSGSDTPLDLEITGCEMHNSRDIVVLAEDENCTVRLDGCDLGGISNGVLLRALNGNTIDFEMNDTLIHSVFQGLDARAEGPGSFVNLNIRGSVFSALGFEGMVVKASGTGTITSRCENCVFHAAGCGIYPPAGQAIHDIRSGGSPAPKHTIANCAFFGNVKDLPNYQPANYTLVTNLVQDPGLVGIGGNITGDPLFVNTLKRDFHVDPSSPVVDAGTNSEVTCSHDMDGDPRIGDPFLSGTGKVDIGVDELYAAHMYAHPNPATLEEGVSFRFMGPAGSGAFLMIGLTGNPNFTFGKGFGLGSLIAFPLFLGIVGGTAPGTGTLEAPLTVPKIPDLIGLELLEQAVYLDFYGGPLTLGFNVFKQTFRP